MSPRSLRRCGTIRGRTARTPSAILGYLTPISQAQLNKLSKAQQTIQRGTDVGATGLEYSYEKYLHGRPGLKQVTVDHLGAVTGTIKNIPPRPGDDIVTNIDAKVAGDARATAAGRDHSARANGYTADYDAGVVMNVRTGGIIAMASSPSYAPNHAPPTLTDEAVQTLQHSPGDPLFDKAFEAAAPPGSTLQADLGVGAAVGRRRATTYNDYDCSPTFDGKKNFEGEVGGPETLNTAIIESCDTVFYRLAQGRLDTATSS